jgi:hypothetical protein
MILDANNVQLFEQVKEYAQTNKTHKEICKKFGLSVHQVRRILCPEWYKESERKKAERDKIRKTKVNPKAVKKVIPGDHNPIYDPRRDGPVYHSSYISEMLGEPAQGRSALDQKLKQSA